ncbi:MAG TPA: hypothetical protein VFS21_24070 [Roseiflexaceae bacterium]|nr:hypothetical protein [Roseiflexaceae bacterium]
MSSEWMLNSETVGRVKELLKHAGSLLEIQAREICANFINDISSTVGFSFRSENAILRLSSKQLVYTPSDAVDEYREVDRLVSISENIKIGIINLSVQTSVPIECKYRRDLEIFAFPSLEDPVNERFPIASELRKSRLFNSIPKANDVFLSFSPSLLSLVEIKDGKTPVKIHEEALIYKAAGALYDFIHNDIGLFVNSGIENYDELIQGSGIHNMLKNDVDKGLLYWRKGLGEWIDKLPDEVIIDFISRIMSERRGGIFLNIQSYMPVVCVNSPIYKVTIDDSLNIEKFDKTGYCVVVVRKMGWPGSIINALSKRSPELPVIVTNPDNLRPILEFSRVWFENIRNFMFGLSEYLLVKRALEVIVYNYLQRHSIYDENSVKYRSDFYFEE